MDPALTPEQTAFLVRRRVARLATADREGDPHVIPVCFAYGGGSVYIALDEKPKGVPPTQLKRVRNISENSSVAFVADSYAEDWSLLAYVLLRGEAELLEPDTMEHRAAVRLLRGKYPQYEGMRIEENPVIAVRPARVTAWGEFGEPEYLGETRPFLDIARGRRSVRRYLPLPVSEGFVEEVLEASRWAPSPHGRQPWRFAVLTEESSKQRLAAAMGEEWRARLLMDGQPPEAVKARLEGSRKRLIEAPVLILLCLYLGELDDYTDSGRQENETTMAAQSLGAAAQNMLLSAYSLGLDGGWMCAPLFCGEKVVEELGLDPSLIPHALLTLGYAEEDPRRRSRKTLDELVVHRDTE